jgi:uncharacterized protein YjbI with pentapeptide repeats
MHDCKLRAVAAHLAKWHEGEWQAVNLGRADFSSTTLQDVMMRDVSLDEAVLVKCEWTRVHMTKVRLDRVKGNRCSLVNSELRASGWSGAELRSAKFLYCDLRQADFSDAVLIDTSLQGCCVHGASWAGTDRSGLRGDWVDISSGCDGGERHPLAEWLVRS